ncbi:MAG: phosphate signaling complex protein PhoU [Phycisphaeraceae bacterium]|nr:phosphate signaling complex protein PhoU [Phycisphaeraceae bacterium]
MKFEASLPEPGGHNPRTDFEGQIERIRRRLVREAVVAVGMLERAIDALWTLDREEAAIVRSKDTRVDREEVAIESDCYRLLTMQHPVAKDFRMIAFVLKVNQDIERVADHASSIAKSILAFRGDIPPRWPTALEELAHRVPAQCHVLLRAVVDEDTDKAREIVAGDKVLDEIHRRLFDEIVETMDGSSDSSANGLLIYRIGRELERVGDLMAAIAEDVVYLRTGQIIRHAKRLKPAGPTQ